MLTMDEASIKVRQNLPDGSIQAAIEWGPNYLFSVFSTDPDEGELDTFYAVNKETGVFSGFSIVGDEDTNGIIDAFDATISHIEEMDSYLEHYGVKGMRWGVRKDEKGGANSASAGAETLLNAFKMPLRGAVPMASPVQKAIMLGAAAIQKIDMNVALKAAFASPLAAVGYTVTALDTGAYRVPGVAARNLVRGGWKKDAKLANPKMSEAEIKAKVVSGVNKDYPGLGTTNNCLRATYTYEMRRRGYDVAATKTIFASGQTFVGSHVMMKSLKPVNRVKAKGKGRASTSDVFDALSKQPDRSRGDLHMRWGAVGGGHSVAYEVINGKPVIFDAQSGKSYSSPQQFNSIAGRAKGFTFVRLDNKKLNKVGLTAWLKDNK